MSVARNSVGNERASRGRQEPNREIRATGESETERGLSLGDKLFPKRTNKIIRYEERDVETRAVYEEIEEYVRDNAFSVPFIINFLASHRNTFDSFINFLITYFLLINNIKFYKS